MKPGMIHFLTQGHVNARFPRFSGQAIRPVKNKILTDETIHRLPHALLH